jgi:hypothetical protein
MDPLTLLLFVTAQSCSRFVKVLFQMGFVQDELHVGKLIFQPLAQPLTDVGDGYGKWYPSRLRHE